MFTMVRLVVVVYKLMYERLLNNIYIHILNIWSRILLVSALDDQG